MSHGIPGMRGTDHVGFTVPDLDEAERFFVECSGAVRVYTLGAKRSDDTTTGCSSSSACTRAP